MTDIGKCLQELLGDEYVLYEYHDTVYYHDNTPDIVDYLYDMRDAQQEKVTKLGLEYYRCHAQSDTRALDREREILEGIKKCIADMESSRARYYVVKDPGRISSSPAQPLESREYELAEAVITKSRRLLWRQTGIKIDCYVFEDKHSIYPTIIPDETEVRGRRIETGDFVGVDAYYLYERVKFNNDAKRIVCPDCNYVWILSKSEEQRFKELNLESPKRCYSCRCKRRQGKNDNNAL